MKLTWVIRPFSELTTPELYALLQLRSEVFVVEQNCPYQDADGKDLSAVHLMGFNQEKRIVACARILPAGLAFPEISIGRVCTSPLARKSGLGKELMTESIRFIEKTYGSVPVRIGAQSYLREFYENLGFRIVSEQYLEDDIPHFEMLRTPAA
jgi:ElaA protein